MRSLGWVLIQYDWCPFRKRKFEHMKTHTSGLQPRACRPTRGDHMRAERGSRLQAKEESLKDTKPADSLILDFLLSKLSEKKFLVFKPEIHVLFCFVFMEVLTNNYKCPKIKQNKQPAYLCFFCVATSSLQRQNCSCDRNHMT